MAFCEFRYFSAALGKQTAASIIVPQAAEEPCAVLYLLHGLSDDHTGWMRRSSIERYVENLPLYVVMPDGGRGFYCDAEVGMKWESSLIEDLVPLVDRTFNTRAECGARCLGGLSMGGYGAVKLALKYPRLFVSANSHSGALGFAHGALPRDHPWHDEFSRIAGPHPAGGSNDCFALASNLAHTPANGHPALRIDCGRDDYLIESNRTFHEHLNAVAYAHEYEEFDGDHNWGYWDEHVREAVTFHARCLGIS